MRFTTHLLLVPRLRKSSAIPLLPLCVFVACTGTASHFYPVRMIYIQAVLPTTTNSISSHQDLKAFKCNVKTSVTYLTNGLFLLRQGLFE
jgi:hypothetical protein